MGLRRAFANFHSLSRVWPTMASSETTSKTPGACEAQQLEEWVKDLPAEDVVCQLGPLHGSPLALSLTISPLHILPLPQVKGLARQKSTLGRSSQQDGYWSTWIGGGRPAERAGHFITGGVGGGASTVARPPLWSPPGGSTVGIDVGSEPELESTLTLLDPGSRQEQLRHRPPK